MFDWLLLWRVIITGVVIASVCWIRMLWLRSLEKGR